MHTELYVWVCAEDLLVQFNGHLIVCELGARNWQSVLPLDNGNVKGAIAIVRDTCHSMVVTLWSSLSSGTLLSCRESEHCILSTEWTWDSLHFSFEYQLLCYYTIFVFFSFFLFLFNCRLVIVELIFHSSLTLLSHLLPSCLFMIKSVLLIDGRRFIRCDTGEFGKDWERKSDKDKDNG